MQYFKTAILRRKAEFNGLVMSANTILKKGRLYHTPRKSNFSKGKRRLEMQYFKTAILRRKAEFNGLVMSANTVATKKKRADKPFAYWLRVIGSASVRLALLQSKYSNFVR